MAELEKCFTTQIAYWAAFGTVGGIIATGLFKLAGFLLSAFSHIPK